MRGELMGKGKRLSFPLLSFFLFFFSVFFFSAAAEEDPRLTSAREKALLIRAKYRPELQKQLKKNTPPPMPVRSIGPGNAFAPEPKRTGKTSVRYMCGNPGNTDTHKETKFYRKSTPLPARNLQANQTANYPKKPRPVEKKRSVNASPLRHAAPVRRTVVRKTAANTVKIRMIRVGNERYCYLNDVARYYRMRMQYYKNGVELRAPNSSIRFYNEKRLGSINHVPVSFLYAPMVRAKTQYFIHEKDISIVLSSIYSPVYAARQVKNILLDPGHGGTDYGALGKNIHEKQMNLETALQVRAGLTALGYRVMMTRSKDQTLTLDQRIALCREKKPDLYISLHCNAAANKSANGIETFAATPFNVPSTGKKIAANIKSPDPGNAFDRHNYRLAYEIQKALVNQTKAGDRGVKVARYKVIREAVCPAALVEMGFITNETEQKRFIDASYRKKIVDGIVLGIHNFAKSLTIVPVSGK